MAVKRLEQDFLERVKVAVERETLSGSNLYKYLKYRIWYGSIPPSDFVMNGDIWRQPVSGANPDEWKMYINGGWVSMLATSTESGLMSSADKAVLNSATTYGYKNSLPLRNVEGGTEFGYLQINAKQATGSPKASGTPISTIFSTNTHKNYINFIAAAGSSDPGCIIHETSGSGADTDKGVLHLCPSDNDTGSDHVAIGRNSSNPSNYTAKIRLYTDGRIECVSVNTTSSREKKTNIVPTQLNAIDYLSKIDVVDFVFKDDEREIPRIGFIADDTDSLVSGPEQDQMDHANLLGVLIKANQELAARVEMLEKKLEEK